MGMFFNVPKGMSGMSQECTDFEALNLRCVIIELHIELVHLISVSVSCQCVSVSLAALKVN